MPWVAPAEAEIEIDVVLEPEVPNVYAPPALAHQVVEEASWVEDGAVQNMWAGLLASSCTGDGRDESNKLFVGILRQLTPPQVRLLNHACRESAKRIANNGLIIQDGLFSVPFEEATRISGTTDIHRLDVELDHLRALNLLGLLDGGFVSEDEASNVGLTPTPIAYNLYVRCQGSRLSPVEFFGLTRKMEQGADTPAATSSAKRDEDATLSAPATSR